MLGQGSLIPTPATAAALLAARTASDALAAPQAHAQAQAQAKRGAVGKKRDKQGHPLQDKGLAVMHDSLAFNALQEKQAQTDDILALRRAGIREALHRGEPARAKIRVTLTHTLHPPQVAGEPSSVVVHLHGRVLDPEQQPAAEGATAPPALPGGLPAATAVSGSTLPGLAGPGASHAAKHPFTAYLRHVEMQFEPLAPASCNTAAAAAAQPAAAAAGGGDAVTADAATNQQGGGIGAASPATPPLPSTRVVWERGVHTGPHKDSFEVRWRGLPPQGVRVVVSLQLDQQPPRFLLPAALATRLGVVAETKARVTQLLHQHLRQQRLVDPLQHTVRLPPDLAELVGGEEEVELGALHTALLAQLQPCPPITLTHCIRPGAGPAGAEVVDIEYESLPPLNPAQERQAHTLLESLNPDKEMEPLDVELAAAGRQLAEHRRRRAMLLGLAQDPVNFMAGLLASQAKELRITKQGGALSALYAQVQVATAASGAQLSPAQLNSTVAAAAATVAKEFEVQRRTELFKQKWVEDAVIAYLYQTQPQSHALGPFGFG